jgi:hypothetical protein
MSPPLLTACREKTPPVLSIARGERDAKTAAGKRVAFYPATQGAAGGKLPAGKTTSDSPARSLAAASRKAAMKYL